jgi:hypothetical protein
MRFVPAAFRAAVEKNCITQDGGVWMSTLMRTTRVCPLQCAELKGYTLILEPQPRVSTNCQGRSVGRGCVKEEATTPPAVREKYARSARKEIA